MKIRTLLVTALFIKFCAIQAQTVNIAYFNTEHGLPQSTVSGIVQDPEGHLWIGTIGGVSRFNGLTFKNFTRRNGLSENWVTSAALAPDGSVWFGHWAGGLSVWSPTVDSIILLKPEGHALSKPVCGIYTDINKSTWVLTEGAGVFRFTPSGTEPGKGTWESFNTQDGLGSNVVLSFCQDKQGEILFGTEEGISSYNGKDFQNFNVKNGFPWRNIEALLIDHAGNHWVGTRDSGLLVFKSNKLSGEIPLKYQERNGLPENHITALCPGADGAVWAGTNNGGVVRLKQGFPLRIISTREGLSNNKILSLMEDKEGSIWIGTYVGLNQLKPEIFQTFGQSDGLPNSLVWSVTQSKGGKLYLGTEGGMYAFDPSETERSRRFTCVTNALGFQHINFSFVHTGSDRKIWFSPWGEGLGKYDPGNGKIEMLTGKSGLPDQKIYCIANGPDGDLWAGTSQKGALRISPVTNKVQVYNQADGLGSDRVFTIFKDSKNNLWFGTLGGYISRFDGKNFKTFNAKNGLQHPFVLCITETSDGVIWVGTYGGGLYKFDGNAFQMVIPKDEFSSDTPFLLQADGTHIWIGTSQGMDKFNTLTNTFRHFGKEEGFFGIEVNPNAVCAGSDSSWWFGTIGGLVKYNPINDRVNNIEPFLQISRLRILGKNQESLRTVSPSLSPLTLTYKENTFAIDFMGISFLNPEGVTYQYYLEGLQSDWVKDPTTRNTVAFQSVPPGDYTFIVKASNSDGVSNAEPVRFSISIEPPFYLTAWAYIAYAIIALLTVYAVIVFRTRSILKEKILLEQKVRERTVELAQKNKDIMDSLNYAKRIQDAILPVRSEITRILPGSFIFFRPRDIVSGDFYWFAKVRGKICIAAADCTGHGVPGALMSMVGNELLNQVVVNRAITDPAKALTMLHFGVRSALKQGSKINPEGTMETSDGMDIALCTIDLENRSIDFAGANRPLYYVNTQEKVTRVSVFKGDKIPIGGNQHQSRANYTNQTIKFSAGDCFYIFTDGYIDQFGGKDGKKFMATRLREELEKIGNLSMHEQEEYLVKLFDSWKGNFEQVDDVLLIGLKF